MQTVLEVVQPGPLQAPSRWNAAAREGAARRVQAALDTWERRHGADQQQPSA